MIVLALDIGLQTGAAFGWVPDRHDRPMLVKVTTLSLGDHTSADLLEILFEFVKGYRVELVIPEYPILDRKSNTFGRVTHCNHTWIEVLKGFCDVQQYHVTPSAWKSTPAKGATLISPLGYRASNTHEKDAVSILIWYSMYAKRIRKI